MRTLIGQLAWRAIRRVLGLVVLILLVILGTGGAIIVQGSRDDLQTAELAIVMVDGEPISQAARLDRVIELYLKGQVSQIVLLGNDPANSQTLLLNRGVQAVKLMTLRAPTAREQFDKLHAVRGDIPNSDAMLIAEPVQELRLLKIAHDRRLMLQAAPTSTDSTIDLGMVLDEIGAYFVYILAGR